MESRTKTADFGATGSVGRHAVRQAIRAGHIVTTFSRHDSDAEGVSRSVRGVARFILKSQGDPGCNGTTPGLSF